MNIWRRPELLLLCGFLIFLFAACKREKVPVKNEAPFLETGSPTQGAIGNVVNVGQGWNEGVQAWWWFTSQGTQIVPYAWFLNLEEAGSTKLLRSNDNMERLRYLPQNPSELNPDGLPVGFVKDTDPNTGEWFGVNCSACHTAQLTYSGKTMQVEGGPTLGNFNKLVYVEILSALVATQGDSEKFARFQQAVGDPDGTLMKALGDRINFLQGRARTSAAADSLGGHARLDAVNNIFNAVFGEDLGFEGPPNTRPANAPVSYPAVWDAPHTDLVQWAGFVNNSTPGGAVLRNLGEVLGVFATFNFEFDEKKRGYLSSARINQQGWLESWLTDLWSPKWPESILPPIDQEKALRGRAIYLANCVPCHAVLKDISDPKREIAAQMWPIHFIGTDSLNADSFADRALSLSPEWLVRTGKLEGRKTDFVAGPPLPADTAGQAVLVNGAAGILVDDVEDAIVSAIRSSFTHLPKSPQFDPRSYRARPLNGVWATPPFLHNGSVPNLWALLQPASERPTSFWVGNREFDADSVGYKTSLPADGHATRLNTLIPGNSNAGHEFGVTLTDEQKWALIEYIKTL